MDKDNDFHSRFPERRFPSARIAGGLSPGDGSRHYEGFRVMLRITCDSCGKELRAGEDRYVVKIEVFAAHDPAELTEADLDEDHMEAVSQLIQQMEDEEVPQALEPASRHLRYDLCPECRKRYLRDPLSKETAQKFDFSEN
jgi:hypothetical protein